MAELLFLKLGGSLITDKTGVAALRPNVLARVAAEIQQARRAREMHLLVGHGSGSFGHVVAAEHGTRQGVQTAAQWQGFAAVSAAAAQLNRLVTEALRSAGVPALALQPSASAVCADGRLTTLATTPIQAALDAGLVPVVYGDVAFDTVRGGTIIATEEIMAYLAARLRPSWLLLAGETEGVLGEQGQVIAHITRASLSSIEAALGGSRGADVTGGMAAKVRGMLDLVGTEAGVSSPLAIRIFSGLAAGNLVQVLIRPQTRLGTLITA